MYLDGILTGLMAFLIIGLFHPIVIKCEYYFSEKVWPLFLLAGLLFLAVSAFLPWPLASAGAGVLGFTCLWSILELKEQTKRVEKGWFPKNPRR